LQVRECPWANAAAVPQRHACTITQHAARNRNQKLKRKQARSSCPACAHIALTIACMSTYTHHSDLRVLTESSAIALEHRPLGELRRCCENLSSLPRERPRAQSCVQEFTRANAAAFPQRHACTIMQHAARNRNEELKRKQARSLCPACAHIALTIDCMSTHTHHSDLRVLTQSSAIFWRKHQ
jgi:hypothetical protein